MSLAPCDITKDVETLHAEISLPQCRRYWRTIVDNMLDPDKGLEHYQMDRSDARHLNPILDKLDFLFGKPNPRHD
jgi:hypothetical protein